MGRYDAAGNVTGVTTTLPAGTDNQVFCYDALNRLVWAGSTGTPSCGSSLTAGTITTAQYTQTFAYDTLDRLTSITSSGATGASPGSYTYGDTNHLHAATATAGGYSATYDVAGDMLCRAPTSATTCAGGSPTGAQLAYDAERRLTHYQDVPGSAPNVEAWYLYDGSGNRVEQAIKQSGGQSGAHHRGELHQLGQLPRCRPTADRCMIQRSPRPPSVDGASSVGCTGRRMDGTSTPTPTAPTTPCAK